MLVLASISLPGTACTALLLAALVVIQKQNQSATTYSNLHSISFSTFPACTGW